MQAHPLVSPATLSRLGAAHPRLVLPRTDRRGSGDQGVGFAKLSHPAGETGLWGKQKTQQ